MTCFIDTCSYINLTNFEFYKGTLLKLLYEKVDIKFSAEVNYEISNHYDERMPDSLKRSPSIYRPLKYEYQQYEKRIFGNNVTRASGNLGERDNFSSMLDFYLHLNQQRSIVFLSDDLKATEGSFTEPFTSFPVCKIWNSFDAILYLLVSHKYMTVDVAKRAIQALNSYMATDDEKMDPEKTQKRISRIKFYLRCVDRVNNVLYAK